MSKSLDLLNYLSWADQIVVDLILKLTPDEINHTYSENSGSIKDKLIHLVEEYTAWLYDVKSEDWKEAIKEVQKMNSQQLIQQLSVVGKEWIAFVQTTNKNEFAIDEGELKVPITLEEVIFNLVNHSSYHRGQIILMLRILGQEVQITDYYWYKIHLLKIT
ncbi:MAG: DinB family protein [Candidatus Kariarchaeaceae archaeon]|jgi:uncharacterized damage-inducible protein DinB